MPLELPSSPPFALPLVLLPWPEPAEAAGTSGGDTTAPGVNPGPAPPEAPLPGGGRVAAGGEEDGIRAGGWEEWPLLPRRLDGFFTGLGFGLGFACGFRDGEVERGVVPDWTTGDVTG